MKRVIETGFVVIVIVVFLLLVGSCARWKFNECKKVGHSTLYCIVFNGSR
jgi:hypothetical protein